MTTNHTPRHERIVELEHALNYISRQFTYHAEQRISMLRYFMVYIGVLIYGTYPIYSHDHYEAMAIITFLSLLISTIFFFIERRNEELISSARKGCSSLEIILYSSLKEDFKNSKIKNCNKLLQDIQFFKTTNVEKEGWKKVISYKNCLSALYLIIIVAHIVILTMSIVQVIL